MNGFRRLVNAAAGAVSTSSDDGGSTPPLAPSPLIIPTANGATSNGTPNWPPQTPSASMATSPLGSKSTTTTAASTAALFLQNGGKKPHTRNVSSASSSGGSGSGGGNSSRHRPNLSTSSTSSGTYRSPVNTTRPPMPCTSEQEVLASRLQAAQKKLNLETKIRDAAVSLAKVNAASGKKIAKQTDEKLEASNLRVENAQKEFWRISERYHDISNRLMEHRAGVLSLSVRSMEKKAASSSAGDSGYSTPSNIPPSKVPLSPTMSNISFASGSNRPKFEGAHFFAGHADALVPMNASNLEAKLKSATEALAEATRQQASLVKELNTLKLEKEQVSTNLEFDLQSAQETIDGLESRMGDFKQVENELRELRREKDDWDRDRKDLENRLQGGGQGLEARDAELRQVRQQMEQERKAWERERADMEDNKMEDLARLQDEMDRLRDEDTNALRKLQGEMDESMESIQTAMRAHKIPLYASSSASSLGGLVKSITVHLQGVQSKMSSFDDEKREWDTLKRKMEDDIRAGWDKREALSRDVEDARKEREEARKEARTLEQKIRDSPALSSNPLSPPSPRLALSPMHSPSLDMSSSAMLSPDNLTVPRILAMIQPVWANLPSAEARAAKFTRSSARSPSTSTPPSPSSPAMEKPVKSLSELDVRSLKSLYDVNGSANGRGPPSPIPTGPLTIPAFLDRVQALIADDRALIERLVRFAQAHELLKKNAERAQKLATESQVALETYQKQVKTLEDRNMSLGTKQAAVQDELATLQEAVDRLSQQKREIESRAADQAATLQQLTEANNALSAKTLSLAAEAADVSSMERLKNTLEAQLLESKNALDAAQQEIDEMKGTQAMQRIQLLDEMNTLQSDNSQLRAQLRALKK
ncbi:Up-regulated during septation-domain-containing protein [Flagelloscypha sp. PMI_526]|nr:Up-regulated during septation-domain-containing protein [Flagelloscypha sp. PMI_526]